MLLSLSDIIVSCTLLVNAGAVLSFRLPTADQQSLDAPVGEAPRTNRALSILKDLRVFRIFIAFWNALVMALMILWFSN